MHLPHNVHTLAAFISQVRGVPIPEVVVKAALPTLETWADILKNDCPEIAMTSSCPPDCPYCCHKACKYHKDQPCGCSTQERHSAS